MSKPWSGDRRNALVRLVHVGKRELQWDEYTYRAAIGATVPGKTSSRNMSVVQLETLLEHMKSKGFQVRTKAGTRPRCDLPTSTKIRALWLDMHQQGIVKNSSEASLAKYVKRITGVDALQWLSDAQASAVIESLKKWRARATTQGG